MDSVVCPVGGTKLGPPLPLPTSTNPTNPCPAINLPKLQVVLLLARMVLLPLPWKHQLWVQAVEIKAGLASLPRQPASVACCGFVSAARRALDLLTANGAPLRPPLLGDPPSAFHCCWMARTFMLLLVGVLLPAVVALARAQHAAAVAAWVQSAQLRERTSMQRSRSEPSLRSNGSSPKSSPEHGNSPKSVPGGMFERSGSSSSSSISSSGGGGNLLREGSPASSASCSPASIASLDQPSSPASSVGSALAAAGRALSEPAAVGRSSSSPGSLASLEQPCPSSAASSPGLSASVPSGGGHSAASVSLAGGQPLSALPAALLSAPLPLSWVQCLLLLLPASAALWAALELALNGQQVALV